MSALDLIFGAKKKVRIGVNASDELLPIGAIELDASLTENHQHANVVTEFPVEEGANITDHVRRQRDRVTIIGVITDHPTDFGGAGLVQDRSIDAYENLLGMLSNADLITVVTSLNQYDDMILESFSVPRDVQRGQSIEVTMEFVEIITAVVEELPPDPADGTGSGAGTTDLGSQNTTPA